MQGYSSFIDNQQVYHTTVIQSLEAFAMVEGEWQALLARSETPSPNLAHPWLMGYLRCFPTSRPFIVLVRNAEGELVGAAPFKISRDESGMTRRLLRRIQFIGGNTPCVYDWMKVLTGGEEEALVLKAIADQCIQHQALWDVMDLRYALDIEQLCALRQHLASAVYGDELYYSTCVPYLALPNTVEGYEQATANLTAKKNIRRHLRALSRDFPSQTLRLEVQSAGDETEGQLTTFLQQYAQYWEGKGYRTQLSRYPRLLAFYRDMHRALAIGPKHPPKHLEETLRCGLEFSHLKLEDQVVSSNLGLWQGQHFLGHIFTYNPAFKKYGPGMLHVDAIARHAITCGATRLDFGRGDEAYKALWTQEKSPLWNLVVFKNKWSFLHWQSDEALKTLHSRLTQMQASTKSTPEETESTTQK